MPEELNPDHEFVWNLTSLGGFAQCRVCKWVYPDVLESACVNWVNPENTKAKKEADREKRKRATIEYLKSQGLSYEE